MPTILGLS